MGHIVLAGDSIFDNANYVPDRPAVIEQVRRRLPEGWNATLLAVDGHCAQDVQRQLQRLPADTTHIFVSVGGNDALGEGAMLGHPVATVGDALETLYEVQRRFETQYSAMLRSVVATGKQVVVCTVYDAVPGLGAQELMALAAFNEVILREAFRSGIPVIDLRLVCDKPADYSPISPIEPSDIGGSKISRRIAEIATSHDFSLRACVRSQHLA
jgi:hypothetical protein